MGQKPSTPLLHHSNTPILFLLPKHLPKLLAPALQLFIRRQSHHNDLILFHVFLELVVDFRMKDILSRLSENSLRLGAEKEVGEQFCRVGMRRLTA